MSAFTLPPAPTPTNPAVGVSPVMCTDCTSSTDQAINWPVIVLVLLVIVFLWGWSAGRRGDVTIRVKRNGRGDG